MTSPHRADGFLLPATTGGPPAHLISEATATASVVQTRCLLIFRRASANRPASPARWDSALEDPAQSVPSRAAKRRARNVRRMPPSGTRVLAPHAFLTRTGKGRSPTQRLQIKR